MSSLIERLSNGQLADLLAPPKPDCRPLPSIITLARCTVCREWMPERSQHFGQCGACGAFLVK